MSHATASIFIEPEGKSVYLLFGGQASKILLDDGMKELTKAIKNNTVDCALLEVTEGMSLSDLMEARDGWDGYAFLTKKEYNKLNKLV